MSVERGETSDRNNDEAASPGTMAPIFLDPNGGDVRFFWFVYDFLGRITPWKFLFLLFILRGRTVLLVSIVQLRISVFDYAVLALFE